MKDERQDPDKLLKALQEENRDKKRGQLKIFFGYAAGTGKTYAMLKAAHAAIDRGTDVVCGYIEPHPRPQTAALAEGLEHIPEKIVSYGNIELKEFDLDAAIRRNPQLILVDELAHTNAEGCRHVKRYQDIKELLNNGIDVFTTVNVQHIESLNDVVASITGVLVRERIPDSVFDEADQVELIDIEPADLIRRLKAGDVYKEAQAERAVASFFTEDNLTALREIALRRCADRVNLITERARIKSGSDYHTEEHILAGLSSSPSNAKIIRTAARMANAFKGSFTALYVETPESASMEESDRKRLRENMRLAEQLGAQIETVYGDDVPYQIAEFARMSGISKIVIGRSAAARRGMLPKPTLTDRVIQYAPNMDVHVIPDAVNSTGNFHQKRKLFSDASGLLSVRDFVKCAAVLVAATGIGFLFNKAGFSDTDIVSVYILTVLIAAAVTGNMLCSMLSALVSVFVFNFFFTEPVYTFAVHDSGYLITFVLMFAVGMIGGSLAIRLKKNARLSARAAYRTRILFETSQQLQQAKAVEEIMSITANQLKKLLNRDIVTYLAEKEGISEPRVFTASDISGYRGRNKKGTNTERRYSYANRDKKEDYVTMTATGQDGTGYRLEESANGHNEKPAQAGTDGDGAAVSKYSNMMISENEKAVAAWVRNNNKRAGAFTETLSSARCQYLAVRSGSDVYGVVGIERGDNPPDAFENSIILSILGECALALENEKNAREKEEAAVMARNEQLRSNLLRAISHDLRTPLTSISGNASNLLNNSNNFSDETVRRVYTDIYNDSVWLINMVENLLAVTRLDEGRLQLNFSVELLEDIVEEALRHVNIEGTEHKLQLDMDELIFVRADTRLAVQMVINLVDNALKYTQNDSEIRISAVQKGEFAEICVADNGPGIPDEMKEAVFDMFYSGANKVADSRRSLGLGLSLCRSIASAHGCRIWVTDNYPEGTCMHFTLPAAHIELSS